MSSRSKWLLAWVVSIGLATFAGMLAQALVERAAVADNEAFLAEQLRRGQ